MNLAVKISVPTNPVESLSANYVQIPSKSGSMGVLPNHAPLRCVLDTGIVTCRLADDSTKSYFVSGGIVMIHNNVVDILADSAENTKDIDPNRAIAARDRALRRLEDLRDPNLDRIRAEAALRRAIIRLKATDSYR